MTEALGTHNALSDVAPAELADVIHLDDHRDLITEEAFQEQQTALAALSPYDVHVVRRKTHKDPVRTSHGTFYQETARYSDGAVRLTTIGVPNKIRVPYVVSEGDAWFTGPDGFNRIGIEQLVNDGFVVVANHHHGRHSILPTSKDRLVTFAKFLASKSLGKSAAQDHALLNDLAENSGFDTEHVISRGYSRKAMTGEAFLAQAPAQGREVIWSDFEGECFARGVGHLAMMLGVAKQLPAELRTMKEVISQALNGPEIEMDEDYREVSLGDYAKTLDPHPLNLAHELAWQRLLITGDAGKYAKAVPLDAKGVRTIYIDDYSGQQADWQETHSVRPGIEILLEDGSHLSGAELRMLLIKRQRMLNLRTTLEERELDFSGLHYSDVLGER